MVESCKGDEHIGSREFIGGYLRHLLVNPVIICSESSSEGRSHENLELELAKSLTRKGREIRVPEQRYGEKDANTTQFLQRGPISHMTLLAK